jgi:hypothetical protein
MIILFLAVVALGAVTALGLRRYAAWRDRRDCLALNSDLQALTLPYERSARERRQ